MRNINNSENIVILFLPETGIYSYLRGLAVLGDAVAKKGGKVFIIRDRGVLLRTPMMAKVRAPANVPLDIKKQINISCEKYLKTVKRKYGFSYINLSDLADKKLFEEIDSLADESTEDLENIVYKDFPVGKVAQYDWALETKNFYFSNLSAEHKLLYLTYIKNTALVVALTDRICKLYKPSLIMTFNEYAQGQAARYGAEINGVARLAITDTTHFNIDASRISIWENTYSSFFYSHCQNWNKFSHLPIAPDYVQECFDDIIFRLFSRGESHIFSKPKHEKPASIFNKLQLDPLKKVIVVYPSSYDERRGMDTIMGVWREGSTSKSAFGSQIEWLSALQQYVSKRDDIQIVVRIHPREGSRQFGFDSEHLKQLKQKFSETTPGFLVVWPDDPISSYDLLELADVCLNAWSSMGYEAARLGIPVLTYASNITYPNDDFIQVASTSEEYFDKLSAIINMKYEWQHLVKAVRFYHWRTFIPSLDLGETVPINFDDDTVWPEAPASMIPVINDILSGKQDLIEYNIKRWKDSLNENSIAEESEAMRQGIRYFLDKIFYPPTPPNNNIVLRFFRRIYNKFLRTWHQISWNRKFPTNKKEYDFNDYKLEYSNDKSLVEEFRQKTEKNKNLRVIIADGLYAVLAHNGKLLRRMSPVVIKLAKLHHESKRSN